MHVEEDRALLKKMLDGVLSSRMNGVWDVPPERRIWLGTASEDRDRGDYLLAVWDGTLPRKPKKSGWGNHPSNNGNYFRFGIVQGIVELPFVPQAGSLWIYLVPADWKQGEWKNRPPAVAIVGELKFAIEWARTYPQMPTEFLPCNASKSELKLSNKIAFSMAGVSPGEYRVVSAWNKTPPDRITPERPAFWHYESAESSAINVFAAKTTPEILLFCTNRVSADEGVYAGDADLIAAARLLPASPPSAPAKASVADETEVQSTLFFHVVKRTRERMASPPAVVFVGVAKGRAQDEEDPAKELMEKLGRASAVKPISAARITPSDGIVDRATGKRGILVILGEPTQVANELFEAEATAYLEREPHTRNASETYQMRKAGSTWEMVSIRRASSVFRRVRNL